MGEGRCSAIAMLLLCIFVFHSKMIYAATFTVGDAQGWTFGIQNWPAGKTFKEGDILVFNYAPALHDVVKVSESDYNSCVAKPISGSGPFTSGADKITLVKGTNFFLCGVPDHCGAGQKIAVNAN